jgi:hypothetical protein
VRSPNGHTAMDARNGLSATERAGKPRGDSTNGSKSESNNNDHTTNCNGSEDLDANKPDSAPTGGPKHVLWQSLTR